MKTSFLSAATLAFLEIATPALAQSSPFSANPADVKPGTYALDPAHGKITWSVSHLGFSTYVGQFSNVTGNLVLDPANLSKTTLAITVDIASVGTLNPDLDKVLKSDQFFNTGKFPTATFSSTKLIRTGAKTADVEGNLTLHGITKPLILHINFNQAGVFPMTKTYAAGFEGHTIVKRSDFGMGEYTNFITDNVPLDLEGEFHLQP